MSLIFHLLPLINKLYLNDSLQKVFRSHLILAWMNVIWSEHREKVLFSIGKAAHWRCLTFEFWHRVWSEDWTYPPPGIESIFCKIHDWFQTIIVSILTQYSMLNAFSAVFFASSTFILQFLLPSLRIFNSWTVSYFLL